MVSMRLCPVDTVQAHVLYVTIVHCGACLRLLDSVEGWRVGDGRYALVHLFVELAATYGVQLKAAGVLVTEAVLAFETRARSTIGVG
jgi:hypothetical protein